MAGILDDDVQQIRNRVNLVDIIAEQIPLKKSGRTWRGLCPFHHEKTPSFHVDPAKQLYHCFGCGAGGDVFTWLMKTEGLEFREAIETLARKIGYTLTAAPGGQSGPRGRLLKACEEATAFYRGQLTGDKGAGARAYLTKRGLSGLIDEYFLGFSPDWSSSVGFLKERGLAEAEMITAGIAARSARGAVYDRFKDRLISPICDTQGRPIAFGGRVLDDSSPKYLNSPETPLYHKGSVFYGLAQAKNACIKSGSAIVVEGYTDLLALAQAGVRHVVATLGTAFTSEHLRLLSRFADRVILVFDGDEAGLTAAERSSEHISRQRLPGQEVLKGLVDKVDLELLVVVLPDNLDPADFVAKQGAEKFLALADQAEPLITFLIGRIIKRHAGKRSGRTIAATEAAKLISGLPSPVAQEEYMRYLADRLNLPYHTVAQEMARTKTASKSSDQVPPPKRSTPEREFIKLVLRVAQRVTALDDVGVEQWEEPLLKRLGAVLKSLGPGKANAVVEKLHKVDPELRDLVSELLLEPLQAPESEDYFSEIFLRLKELAVERQIDTLRKELAETDREEKRYDDIFTELMALEYKRRELKNQTNGGSLWVKN